MISAGTTIVPIPSDKEPCRLPCFGGTFGDCRIPAPRIWDRGRGAQYPEARGRLSPRDASTIGGGVLCQPSYWLNPAPPTIGSMVPREALGLTHC